MLFALVLRIRMALGHLGHLGHGFKLHGHAGQPVDLGSFGSFILRDPNDLKGWRQRARSFKALGHLGHFVTSQKLVRDAAWASPNSLLRVYPYIKIFYFLNWKP